MATIKYSIQGKSNLTPIYVRFQDGRKKVAKAKTGYFIDRSRWSNARCLPIGTNGDEKNLINRLKELESKILIEYQNSDNHVTIDSKWLYAIINKKELKKSDEDEFPPSLVDYFSYYYEQKKMLGSKLSLLKKINSQKAIYKAFDTYKRKKHLLTEIDLKYGDDLIRFLKTKKKYKQSYIFRTIKFLKTVCRDAARRGAEVNEKFEMISTKDEVAHKIYLNPNEIDRIRYLNLDKEYLDNARDWLLISCFTGQRISDFMNFTSQNIKRTSKGVDVISYTQKKTGKPHMSILLKEVREILDKRNGEFPRKISDQKYNKYVKEVARLAELNELIEGTLYDPKIERNSDGLYEKWRLISSHIGRRSFATNYYGIYPTSMLMAQTSHSTERAFLQYIGKGRLDYVESFAELIKNNEQ